MMSLVATSHARWYNDSFFQQLLLLGPLGIRLNPGCKCTGGVNEWTHVVVGNGAMLLPGAHPPLHWSAANNDISVQRGLECLLGCRAPNVLWEVNELLTAIVWKLCNHGHGCWAIVENYYQCLGEASWAWAQTNSQVIISDITMMSINDAQAVRVHSCIFFFTCFQFFGRWPAALPSYLWNTSSLMFP